MNFLADGFATILAASWRAGLLILLFLALRRLSRGWLPAQVLFAGWILVALRLLIPFGVPAAWSPYNFVKPIQLAETVMEFHSSTQASIATASASSVSISSLTDPSTLVSTRGFALIWITGVIFFLTLRIGASWSFRKHLRCSHARAEMRLHRMVRQCAGKLGLQPRISIIVTDAVSTPALYGIWRTRLLIPTGFAEKLSDNELRLVVLHELGHWKRRDLLVHSLMQAARIIHWFNPLVWSAAWLTRLDCELACDEFVLRRENPDETLHYGSTLIKVLGMTREPLQAACGVGILENSRHLKLRIRMIVAYNLCTMRRALIGSMLLGMLAIVSVTHESLAQNAVEKVAAVISYAPPTDWIRVSQTRAIPYEVGVDGTQSFHQPNSVFVRTTSADAKELCGLAQACSAWNYHGKRVRFSVWMKTEDVQGRAGLWFRVDGEKRHGLQFDDMKDRPVKGTTAWTQYSAVLDVPKGAISLNYGFSVVEGTGRAWFNDPKIEIVGSDVPSTNLAHTHPGLCSNPKCGSSITGVTAQRYATLANSSFIEPPRK